MADTDTTDAAVYNTLRLDMFKRAALWAVLGHVGGLVALGTKAADDLTKQVAYLVLPSLWAFAIGLVAALLLNVMLLIEYNAQFEAAIDPKKRTKDKADASDFVFLAALIVTPTAFCFGLFYPLVVVSLRYFGEGTLIG